MYALLFVSTALNFIVTMDSLEIQKPLLGTI